MTEKEIENMPTLLTVSEMAQVLRIGRNSAYELVYQKNFPILKLGQKNIRIPKGELLQWIKANTDIYQFN
jgi:excisionase family DNA binding protein